SRAEHDERQALLSIFESRPAILGWRTALSRRQLSRRRLNRQLKLQHNVGESLVRRNRVQNARESDNDYVDLDAFRPLLRTKEEPAGLSGLDGSWMRVHSITMSLPAVEILLLVMERSDT